MMYSIWNLARMRKKKTMMKRLSAEEAENSDVEQDEKSHAEAIKNLSKTDPEFFKFLQENDKNLLEFDESDDEQEDGEDDAGDNSDDDEAAALAEMEGSQSKTTKLTNKMLRDWQRAIINHRSLRSFKKLILAFRSAAFSTDMDDVPKKQSQNFTFEIDSADLFNKVVLTAFKYTPIVLAHHWPCKELPNGRFKLSPSPNSILPKLVSTYLNSALFLIGHFPATSDNLDDEQDESEGGILKVAVSEVGKVIPYVVGGRKGIKSLLKVLLELWSSAKDSVRIAAYMSIRKIALAGDTSVVDLTLKSTYLTFIRTCKQTSVHTLPSINLMKNTAAELYNMDHGASYQQAFGYIRQLAILLRGAMKTKSKESFRQVYNWQYVHCVDFWSLVLSWANDKSAPESELQALIYPLVQVSLGAIRLVPTSRYFPLRFHMIRSLLRLEQRTGAYIPIAAPLLEILSSAEFKRQPKKSTLKPIDFENYIRVPTTYSRTRVYVEGLADELVYILSEAFFTVGTSIAFPESIVPVVSILRKTIKKSPSGPKVVGQFKALVERLESQAKLIETERTKVDFSPGERGQIDRFMEATPVESTTLGSFVKILRKARDQKRSQSTEIKDDDDSDLEAAPDAEEVEDDEELEEMDEE
ncbi:Noc2-domain-containing protein [Wallemia mellicola CBS 633.66]|uniref:Noc2-domain-containing protein n=1 Tax=Wallemia mellicola (strain ATCC MYA-4683 / CBS 633.66) TaxID=671144 RepID=I4Y5K3_WALMC|nr:Noc2-domain-containing protein [Wallemia mellicola CBS 633.66]EIM19245.1 Noc2-domain-containing protein [Wallemia mellicola CBS 633.66]|eukprot:XP_006960742.1 Noc2-domain-containing protein [Wallemia mellicola CBS 633.66]